MHERGSNPSAGRHSVEAFQRLRSYQIVETLVQRRARFTFQ